MALQPFLNWPLSPFDDLNTLADQVFNDPLLKKARTVSFHQPGGSKDFSITHAAMDVKEDKDGFKFIADVPGMKKEEVKLQLEEPEPGRRILSISGERVHQEKKEGESYHRVERSFGKFTRRFGLPNNVDVAKISAKCDNGVLIVTVPKIPESAKQPQPTQIQVHGD